MRQVTVIDVQEWDQLVKDTYGKPYSFQQQDYCKDRGVYEFSVPEKYPSDYKNDTVPEVVNHMEIGVSFKAWLGRDQGQLLTGEGDQESWSLTLWWDRNFYPHVEMIIADLNKRGLLEEGDYLINIDW